MNNSLGARTRAYQYCPTVDRPAQRSYQAAVDAIELVGAVRDLDPCEVWGTLAMWNEADPLRLYAVVVALAAMVPAGQSARELLAWTEDLVPLGQRRAA
jgi:hypothetical protein